jgi:hypothetical protein
MMAVVEKEGVLGSVRLYDVHVLEAIWTEEGVPFLAAAGTISDILRIQHTADHIQ